MESVFDLAYLITGAIMGIVMLTRSSNGTAWLLAGSTALVLILGDSFHLLPRVAASFSGQEERYRKALGRGKQVTSVTMTIFYLLLWHTVQAFAPEARNGVLTVVLYILAVARIVLCLCPQNGWTDREPPVRWGLYRNIPFFIMGALVVIASFLDRAFLGSLGLLWLAVLLSFAFYAPVTLWAHKNRMLGILMLPKTCMYIWIMVMLIRM